MPTKDIEKIRNVVYMDGKPIKGIQEIELELPEISTAKEKFIDIETTGLDKKERGSRKRR